jgi:phosphonate transport system permease protein
MAASRLAELTAIVIPRPPLAERARTWAVGLLLIALLTWSWSPAEMFKAKGLWTDYKNMGDFLSAFLHPNFKDWELYLREMVVTIQIALWGTVLSVVFGIPFAILSSSNVCPAWVVQPVRRLMDCFRAINELVMALIFVVAVGLGPFAGVMALFVHNTGVVSKLFSEAVEAIDPRPVEGIRATGASKLQEIIYGIVPQVLPLWSSFALYRFETNVRSATTLGIIGAGGIGQIVYESIRSFQYSESAAVMIIVVVAVMFIDVMSSQLRKVLI